jgi:hypothetical protein
MMPCFAKPDGALENGLGGLVVPGRKADPYTAMLYDGVRT